MSKSYIAKALRDLVAQQSRHRCGYCLTPTGRATVLALNINRPALVRARRLWVSVGWHPPID